MISCNCSHVGRIRSDLGRSGGKAELTLTAIKRPLGLVAARTHERQQYVAQRPHTSSEPIRGSASDRFPATRTYAADPEETLATLNRLR
ncbi:MAG: hypothetical protein ACO305_14900 [Rubrivivax sp.]